VRRQDSRSRQRPWAEPEADERFMMPKHCKLPLPFAMQVLAGASGKDAERELLTYLADPLCALKVGTTGWQGAVWGLGHVGLGRGGQATEGWLGPDEVPGRVRQSGGRAELWGCSLPELLLTSDARSTQSLWTASRLRVPPLPRPSPAQHSALHHACRSW